MQLIPIDIDYSRLFQLVGSVPESETFQPPFLQYIFHRDAANHYLEIPGKLGFSQLDFNYFSKSLVPEAMAWLTGIFNFESVIDI